MKATDTPYFLLSNIWLCFVACWVKCFHDCFTEVVISCSQQQSYPSWHLSSIFCYLYLHFSFAFQYIKLCQLKYPSTLTFITIWPSFTFTDAERKKFRDQFLYAEQELAATKGREQALQEQLLKEVNDSQERLRKQIHMHSELEVEH